MAFLNFFLNKAERRAMPLLEEGEKIVLLMKQSLFSDIAPSFIVATDKRLIIINNSFWGLYFNYNFLTPTDYNNIFYKQITSVVLVRGRFLNTIDVRILGGFENRISPQKKTEGEIEGLRSKDGVKLTKFLNEMVLELRESAKMEEKVASVETAHPPPVPKHNGIHLRLHYAQKGVVQESGTPVEELPYGKAHSLVASGHAKFVWLGSEDVEYISRVLNVEEGQVLKFDPDTIEDMNEEILRSFGGHVFVCYNGNLSRFVSEYLKKQYNIDSYSLKGGVMRIAVPVF